MKSRNWTLIIGITFAGFVTSLAIVLSVAALLGQRQLRTEVVNRTDVRLCNEIEKIKGNIRASIIKSDKQIQNGNYQSLHLSPADRDLAHQQALDQLKVFGPIKCQQLPSQSTK